MNLFHQTSSTMRCIFNFAIILAVCQSVLGNEISTPNQQANILYYEKPNEDDKIQNRNTPTNTNNTKRNKKGYVGLAYGRSIFLRGLTIPILPVDEIHYTKPRDFLNSGNIVFAFYFVKNFSGIFLLTLHEVKHSKLTSIDNVDLSNYANLVIIHKGIQVYDLMFTSIGVGYRVDYFKLSFEPKFLIGATYGELSQGNIFRKEIGSRYTRSVVWRSQHTSGRFGRGTVKIFGVNLGYQAGKNCSVRLMLDYFSAKPQFPCDTIVTDIYGTEERYQNTFNKNFTGIDLSLGVTYDF